MWVGGGSEKGCFSRDARELTASPAQRPPEHGHGPSLRLWASLLHFPGVGKAYSALEMLLKMIRRSEVQE